MSHVPVQPIFSLLAQDITADLVVDFWMMVQLRVWGDIAEGTPLIEAVERARAAFGVPLYQPFLHHGKLDGASRIAWDMRAFPTRRLAD